MHLFLSVMREAMVLVSESPFKATHLLRQYTAAMHPLFSGVMREAMVLVLLASLDHFPSHSQQHDLPCVSEQTHTHPFIMLCHLLYSSMAYPA